MATVYGDIQGIKWLREDPSGSGLAVVEVAFTMGAYTASSDNGQLGGNSSAGTKHGAANDTLETILASDRKDGKTVDILTISTSIGLNATPGLQGSTLFYINTPAESTGNLTFNLSNVTGSEIDAASGVTDRPIAILLNVLLS